MKKIVIIDHQDSFTYNIVELIRQSVHINPEVIAHHEVIIENLDKFDHIILSPGPGLPRDFIRIKQILDRYKYQKSILGICLGHQAIATYFGAKLYNLPQVVHGQPQKIMQYQNTNLFKNIPKKIQVGLYHSWAVNPASLPDQLFVTAISSSNVIMGIKHRNLPLYGMQFHPESYMTEYGHQLLKNFIYA